MAVLIDWHAHHVAPEVVDKVEALGGRRPRADANDSPDFAGRLKEMDDAGALGLAGSIADKIQTEMQYPGQIKVTVIRETRSVEYAR